MSSYDIDLSIAVRSPPRAVFDLLAHIQDVEPIPRSAHIELRKDRAGPTRVGTRWHERVRPAPGFWLQVESVVTECASRPFSAWTSGAAPGPGT